MVYIGVDLGGTNIAVGVVNENWEIVAEASTKTLHTRPYQEVIKDMAVCADKALEKAGLTHDDVKSIGIGIPGCADENGNVIVEPIYPYLKPMDTVCNAPDSDLWHTLIEADNYHALQLLEYLYAGKVDCIYIDPPYNTGARDWKYNNDYVDGADTYRHSKWLSFMQKRLKLAKKLLNPKDSVLIVTIDEKEYLHLGCLLEEMFPESESPNPPFVVAETKWALIADRPILFLLVGVVLLTPRIIEDPFRMIVTTLVTIICLLSCFCAFWCRKASILALQDRC